MSIKVIELFAGVGGFRLGLERTGHYEVVWSNQWEPSTKNQDASEVYEARFGPNNHCNRDISEVPTSEIPDADLLVGGFPCQDYSVASTLQNAKGLIGKKGVLWWSVHRILSEKKSRPKYLLLENVDRLLKSPATQRGRDFAIILKSLSDLGYAVEWRVINAADYGMPQRRKRIFFLAYELGSKIHGSLIKVDKTEWIYESGVLARAFPVVDATGGMESFLIQDDLVTLSKRFNEKAGLSPFLNTGVFVGGKAYTCKTLPKYNGKRTFLGDVLQNGEVKDDFYLSPEDLPKWIYLKGAKKEVRNSKKNGFEYNYAEGKMIFPDALNKASRTIITGEGGRSASRFKHVVQTKNGLRRLTPVELERLNMFPDEHTKLNGVSDRKRAFFMGNALVVGVVEKIGDALYRSNA
jgi:DNA (cytosine-5)-methyltransferase 1